VRTLALTHSVFSVPSVVKFPLFRISFSLLLCYFPPS
jgi:hypothetical protein